MSAAQAKCSEQLQAMHLGIFSSCSASRQQQTQTQKHQSTPTGSARSLHPSESRRAGQKHARCEWKSTNTLYNVGPRDQHSPAALGACSPTALRTQLCKSPMPDLDLCQDRQDCRMQISCMPLKSL